MIHGGNTKAFQIFAMRSAVLASAAIGVFWAFYALDFIIHAAPDGKADAGPNPLLGYFAFDPPSVNNPISSLTGIRMPQPSVSSSPSAEHHHSVGDRQSIHRRRWPVHARGPHQHVRRRLLRRCCCVVSVWLSGRHAARLRTSDYFRPGDALTTVGLVVMVPYFAYVFWFLEPKNIIARIRRRRSTAPAKRAQPPRSVSCAEAQIFAALEELTDIAPTRSRARTRSSPAAPSMRCRISRSSTARQAASATPGSRSAPGIRLNPDFVAMDPESLRELEPRRTWVEWKVMRQYLGIYGEALGAMRDINYLIAIDTRYIGEAAAEAQDDATRRAGLPLHELLPARDAQREGRPHRLQRAQPVPAARGVHAAAGRAPTPRSMACGT